MSSRLLPIFPLGLVLQPGTAVPLHLFEPRYRQMLTDVRASDQRFGIICAIPGVAERDLPVGRVGCVAEVTEVEMLPDGRSNIMVVGRERFTLTRFVDHDAPYHVAEVASVPDDDGDPRVAVAVAADEVVEHFRRVVRAVHALNDDDAPPPALPDDPSLIAWAIAGMVDFDLNQRQALLESRSPLARLTLIDGVLRRVLPDLELKAAMHTAGA
ncbi:MAG TPA: LON peptidase substrate-binding domain-containing protein [Gemmatimonadaceae bacterium]|nr:LON peptidase substrate-binding domain-containing protein [Gemmatimonadaceae bacterium]